MTDTQALKKIIQDSGYKIGFLAEKCGITVQSLSRKINNKSLFNINEVYVLSNVLEIDPGDCQSIFFAQKVQ